jgi:hypothetical protein
MKNETFLLTGTEIEKKKPDPIKVEAKKSEVPVAIKRPVESDSDEGSEHDDGWVFL